MKQNKSIKEILQKQKELIDESKGNSPRWEKLSVKFSNSIQAINRLEVHLRQQDQFLPKCAEVVQ